ncbi:sensor histidine kinase [Mucilaginibacter aquariorum]|uniref:Histidine kinase n=1 Tax=Mucilaginibacter aquariorum TaxID=2967225 RepID=A0ABT1T1U1_9SPHI|nr:histidine kinase [Mucilaginibacter aquariorum]MCQ6958554.1 histidine kinase [Mucilaginibacter aquariorum]
MKQLLKNIFPGLYGLLNYFTIRLLHDLAVDSQFWKRDWALNVLEMSCSILAGYISINLFRRLFRYYDRHQASQLRYQSVAKELFILVFVNLIAVCVILLPMAALTDDGLSWVDVADLTTIPTLYAIIYYGIARSSTWFSAYVANQLLIEKLTNDHLETELKFLRAQYHPHFLFNALNTIYFQVDDDVPGAKQSIELLSELLRYQLYDRQHQVTIKQELDYLQNYMLLQKVRASKKMILKVEFDKALTDQQIYPLLFLPLVENAFKYVGGKYSIDITATQTPNGVLFTVKNDLPDLTQPNPDGSGIGIENLNRRLELLYPNRHRLTLTKQADHFFAELELKLI